MLKQSVAVTLILTGLCLTTVGCSSRTTTGTDEPPVRSVAAKEGSNIKTVSNETAGDFVTTKSGLKYRILRESTGPKPGARDTVKAHYRGWLDNGIEFDSSYKRGEPTEFSLQKVIKGWTEGLQYIGEGGKIELEIPSELGYGSTGAGSIPGGATLHFEVELIEVL